MHIMTTIKKVNHFVWSGRETEQKPTEIAKDRKVADKKSNNGE